MSEAASSPAASSRVDLGALAPGLTHTCDEYLGRHRLDLEEMIRRGEPGVAVARAHMAILDGLLGALFCASDAAVRKRGGGPSGRVALAAVGGYGRGLVGLRSDVDVLFLCDDPADPQVGALAEAVLYPLWDLGLEIGHAVRGVDETLALGRSDVRTATTLLDLRRVAGDVTIVDDLTRGGRQKVFEPCLAEFLTSLSEDLDARHERFGGSLFMLEPEVKLGRGGLRDLDVAVWAARARWGGAPVAASGDWEDLVRSGAFLAREVKELEAAREMLWRVRNSLHLRARRGQDRLTFEDQEEIAVELGFVDGVTLAVEQFMQAYYRHARTVAQMAERVLDRARPQPRGARRPIEELGDGILVFDGQLTLERAGALADDPTLALRFYKQVGKRSLPPYAFARDAIARAAADPAWAEKLREARDAAKLFLQLLTHVGDVPLRRGSLLGELHEVGLLLAMIPEFGPVTGRVQHDVYHVYTVDVHSVAAVDRLRAIMRGELASTMPMACRVAAETPRPVPLFLGLLLHDIGKAHGKDHSRKGAVIARPIAERLGLGPIDVEHVVWLVLEHLSLYHWAMRRDTGDPETLHEVARHVGTLDRLRDLYLLTVADLSTTSPTAMTSWKARMLEELYLGVIHAIDVQRTSSSSTLTGETALRRAEEIRHEVEVGFVGDAGQEELGAFLRDMPDRYFLANPVDTIRQHARVARDRLDDAVHVALLPGPSEDVAEVVIAMDDRPGLLADMTAALSANRFDVTGAQIYTRPRDGSDDEAFDVFHVRHTGRVEDALAKLRRDLTELARGGVTSEQLLGARSRPPAWAQRRGPDVPTEVHVSNEVSSRYTVVDVYTRDRVGLLHAIARALHGEGLSIAISKVNTEGTRVADVFYVTDAGGGKVAAAKLAGIEQSVRKTIVELDLL